MGFGAVQSLQSFAVVNSEGRVCLSPSLRQGALGVGTRSLGSDGRVHVLAPPDPYLLTLSKWLNLPDPQFPHLQNEDNNSHYIPCLL